ncbi:TolC family protein [Mucilaginibacter gossypii]|uniref:TolC family protein n=1 Tax=Mucilaginibacter gossypii TaxID=551996 RepID=UPI000DCE8EF5|nr:MULTISPECIES: TolC family protein [Mucilaginibacter]QTE36475.1 TolC family protein [Mucilaginibacter gossypii]RAV48635.1 TolC family protein [Mucilaginibacter rubeus]
MNKIKQLIKWALMLYIGIPGFLAIAQAQDIHQKLSLNEAILAALANNKAIRVAGLDERIAESNFNQTQAIFLPQVDLSYTAMSTNNPLSAFGFKLQQRSITQNDFNPAFLNHPSATPDYMAQVEVKQPLLNIDMLYMRKGAEKQTEIYRYKTQRTQEYTTFEITKAFLQLQLAYQAEKVLTEARQTAKSVYTFTENHFKQGLIQKSDLLNAQVHVTSVESNLAKARSSILNASDYLSLLMGQPTGKIYSIADEPQTNLSVIDSTQKIFANRSDFMAMQKAIDASSLMIKSSQMSYLPKLNAFGNYQYNDSRLAGFGAKAYLVGIQLSWNVFNGNKTKHVIAAQKLERDKLTMQLAQQKDQSQLELDKAYRDLSDAQFEMGQDQAAIEQAAEALRILQNRYQQGLVNTTDILTSDTQLSQLKFSLAQARFTADVTNAYITLLTTTTTK